MNPTPELRIRLRKLLNATIKQGQTEADTDFLDADIDDLLKEAVSLYGAASAGWMMKVGMMQGDIESYTSGQESYKLTKLSDMIAHAEGMAKHYRELDAKPAGQGMFLAVTRPEVL